MAVRLFIILIAALIAAPEAQAAKSANSGASPCFVPPPLVILTPACTGSAGRGGSEQCEVLKDVADGAREGALAAIEGRDMLVLTRDEATAALALYGLPAPCAEQVGCSLESAHRINAGYVITGTVAAVGSARKRSWKIALQLYRAGTGNLVRQSGTIETIADAGLPDAVKSLAEALVRPAVEPEPLGRRSRDKASASAADVLVTFEAPEAGIVRVDGRLACVRTPCARLIPKGEHEAVFEQENFAPTTVKFTAEKGAKVKTKLVFAGDRQRLAVLVPERLRCSNDPTGKRRDRCWAVRALVNGAETGAKAALAGRDAEVIWSNTVEKHFDRKGVIASCPDLRNCGIEIARVVGSDYVLSGDVTGTKSPFTATLELRDVKTGKLLLSRSKRLSASDSRGGLSDLARTLMTEALELKPVSDRFPLSTAVEGGWVRVVFESGPETGAAVSVDGRFACWTPCARDVASGEHRATFEQLRFEPSTVQFAARRNAVIKGELAPDFGWIGVKPDPLQLGIGVSVDDGRKSWKMDYAGVRWREVDAGEVELTVEDACFLPTRERVTVNPGERHLVPIKPQRRLTTLEVHATDEYGKNVIVPVKLDGQEVGAAGARLEVPLCYFLGPGHNEGERGKQRIVSVPFEEDTFATPVVLKEEETTVVTASPVPLPPEGTMASLPGGTFTMGETNRVVTVAPFRLDVTEVTAQEFADCVEARACTAPERERDYGFDPFGWQRHGFMWSGPAPKPGEGCTYQAPGKKHHPVNCVTWDQASDYCAWKKKRLPTEEEWEWAARGGEQGTGNPCDQPGNEVICGDGNKLKPARGFLRTCRVGSYPGGDSPQGVKDLAGNVSEWTSSVETRDHAKDEDLARRLKIRYRDPRVVRGGSWKSGGYKASDRKWEWPTRSNNTIGFRCAQTP